jgi:hypothetical protein
VVDLLEGNLSNKVALGIGATRDELGIFGRRTVIGFVDFGLDLNGSVPLYLLARLKKSCLALLDSEVVSGERSAKSAQCPPPIADLAFLDRAAHSWRYSKSAWIRRCQ